MDFFKPIWEKHPDKIRAFIERAQEKDAACQRKLAQIALHCPDPELRLRAAKRLREPSEKALLLKTAREKEDAEIIQAIISAEDARYDNICSTRLFSAVVKAKDLGSLALLALRIRSLNEWNRHAKELQPLLDHPGFEEVLSHYENLKRIDEEEEKERKREVAKKKSEEKRQIRKNKLLFYPDTVLSEPKNPAQEEKLWKEYYACQLEESFCSILFHASHALKTLPWYVYFPEGAVRKAVLDSNRHYAGDNGFRAKDAERELNAFLGILYEKREDLRDEILTLNGEEYFEGREGSTVNFGDHHGDWFVSFDPIPSFLLSVACQGKELEIHLAEKA